MPGEKPDDSDPVAERRQVARIAIAGFIYVMSMTTRSLGRIKRRSLAWLSFRLTDDRRNARKTLSGTELRADDANSQAIPSDRIRAWSRAASRVPVPVQTVRQTVPELVPVLVPRPARWPPAS